MNSELMYVIPEKHTIAVFNPEDADKKFTKYKYGQCLLASGSRTAMPAIELPADNDNVQGFTTVYITIHLIID